MPLYANFYQFTGRRGETILIEAKAVTGDLDPLVILRDNQEVNLATNDDADPATKDARLEYTLPTTGRHVIAVTRYGVREGLTSGGYELTSHPCQRPLIPLQNIQLCANRLDQCVRVEFIQLVARSAQAFRQAVS
ncbi:MAG UNVERIFIED_CONTAM: PPC domain-containing protein [Anaerolineae bacterium]